MTHLDTDYYIHHYQKPEQSWKILFIETSHGITINTEARSLNIDMQLNAIFKS